MVHCKPSNPALRSRPSAGKAMLTTVASSDAIPEPRTAATTTHLPDASLSLSASEAAPPAPGPTNCGARSTEVMRCSRGAKSAFYVAQLLGNQAVADSENVDTTYVAIAPFVAPADHAAVARGELLFCDKSRVGVRTEEVLPECSHGGSPCVALPIGCGASVFEQAVFGHRRHDAID